MSEIPEAFTKDEHPVYAGQYTREQWVTLKAQSLDDPFVFKMPCCASRAVLKGLQFFAHYSDECATAPDTIWHIEAKDLVFGALKLFGLDPRSEAVGGTGKDRWRADVYVEMGERKVAIELQRSYQHLRDFVRRQERYARSGVECYWLVRHEVGRTLGKAIMTKHWKEEFDRKIPPHGHMINTWPAFYFGMLISERDPNVITPGLQLSHFELLAHIDTTTSIGTRCNGP